jgi:hypothetical protein
VLAWAPIRYRHKGDVSIAYTVGGGGPVDVLLIGGFVSHLEIFRGACTRAAVLGANGVIRADHLLRQAGYGRVGSGGGAYTLENSSLVPHPQPSKQ